MIMLMILSFFAASYQAFCEFIDNSIQATSVNNTKDMERVIDVHIFLKDVSDINSSLTDYRYSVQPFTNRLGCKAVVNICMVTIIILINNSPHGEPFVFFSEG